MYPAAFMGHVKEVEHVLAQLRTGKRRFEIANQHVDSGLAVDTLHDFSGARREPDHSLRIEQHPRRLLLLDLQPEMAGDLRRVIYPLLHFRQHAGLRGVHTRSAWHRASTT